MPQRQPGVPPPFDEGVFLMHYNHARESFEEGKFGEARRDLEAAQRLRPDDSDVLNLLGMVYFKMNAIPDAEVIYRRLVEENQGVFILHANLGLILFKQGLLDEAEKHLLKAVELRPNYAKSHLYLGLLYKQRGKLGLALEHLGFAGAEKAVRDLEAELNAIPRSSHRTSGISRVEASPVPLVAPDAMEESQIDAPADNVSEALRAPSVSTREIPRVELPGDTPSMPPEEEPFAVHEMPGSAAQKLRNAVDEGGESEERTLDLGRKIEGASKTFTLHENGFLEIDFRKSVYVKRGTVSSYSGNLKFADESGLVGTTAQTLVKATGPGKLFVYEKGRKTFLLDLNDEFIYVEGGNLLALEDSLSYRVEPIYDTSYQKKIDTVKIFGKGSLAISTSIEPLTLRVTREYPLSISSNSLVAWTGEVIPIVIDEDRQLAAVMIEETSDHAFRIRFEGDGVVVAEE